MNMDDLRKLMRGDIPHEDLVPELEATKKLVNGKWQLRHPLVTEEEYDPFSNFDYNTSLLKGKEEKGAAIRAKNWDSFLQMHDKTHWPVALTEIQPLMTHDEWGVIVSPHQSYADRKTGRGSC